MPVQFTCSTCGQPFMGRPSSAARYCSRDCWHARPKKADIAAYACEQCGKRFHRPPSSFRNTARMFCSPQCFGLAAQATDDNGRSLHRPGVYALIQASTNTAYIGSSRNLAIRRRDHFSALRSGRHYVPALQAAWALRSGEEISFSVLEHVADESRLIAREQAWIDRFVADGWALFNQSPTAGSSLGVTRDDAQRRAMRQNPKRRFRGKLSRADVLAIKAGAAQGATLTDMAQQYGVHRHTIYMIASGRAYGDIHAATTEASDV